MGTGYYAKAYWRNLDRLRHDGQALADELERNDRANEAKALRAAIDDLKLTNGFADAESRLTRLRTICYSTLDEHAPVGRGGRRRLPLLPPELRANVPAVLRSVFDQVQGCYSFEFWDAALVMIRKLTESLIIEGYELAGEAHQIKTNGQYLNFGDLAGKAKSGSFFRLARDSKAALDAVKSLGDNAAHNPRFLGRRSDLDGLRNGLRILTEDLTKNIGDLKSKHSADTAANY